MFRLCFHPLTHIKIVWTLKYPSWNTHSLIYIILQITIMFSLSITICNVLHGSHLVVLSQRQHKKANGRLFTSCDLCNSRETLLWHLPNRNFLTSWSNKLSKILSTKTFMNVLMGVRRILNFDRGDCKIIYYYIYYLKRRGS